MDFLDKITAAFAGYRTFLIALVGVALSVADAMHVDVPTWVLTLLGSLGLYTLRTAVGRAAQ